MQKNARIENSRVKNPRIENPRIPISQKSHQPKSLSTQNAGSGFALRCQIEIRRQFYIVWLLVVLHQSGFPHLPENREKALKGPGKIIWGQKPGIGREFNQEDSFC